MKKILLSLLAGGFLFACRTEREVQANLVMASLVKIDTLHRYPNVQQKILTWYASDHVYYVTYEPIYTQVAIGTTRQVLIRR